MINNHGGGGGTIPTATFRFAYEMADGRETLNGNPIAKGETVELEIGSRNLLISADDYSDIYTEETYERVPWCPQHRFRCTRLLRRCSKEGRK